MSANMLSDILDCRSGMRGKQQRSRQQTSTHTLKPRKMRRKRMTCRLHVIYVDVHGKKSKILW